METVFYCAEKTNRVISLVGRSMQRIYKAARQCGYLQNVIQPIDSRDSKKRHPFWICDEQSLEQKNI